VHEQETYGLLGRLNWDLAMLVELAKKDEDAMEALAKALAVFASGGSPKRPHAMFEPSARSFARASPANLTSSGRW
jgi:hypothetical protein